MNKERSSREPITAEERALRQYASDAARGSMRLEGLVRDEVVETLYRRYVAGEITRQELDDEVERLAASLD